MKRIKTFLFLVTALIYTAALAQEDGTSETVIINNDTTSIKAIPLVEISQKTEDVYKELKNINEILASYNDQKSIDSLIKAGRAHLLKEKMRLENTESTMSSRELLDEKKAWKKIRQNLETWRNKFNERTVTLDELKKKTGFMLKEWTLTLTKAKKEKAPLKLRNDIKVSINDIQKVDNELTKKQNQLYLNQNNVTEFVLAVDGIINNLEEVRLTYMDMDSPPIWKTYDTLGPYPLAKTQIHKYLNESSKGLNSFFTDTSGKIAFHLFVIILIIIFLYLLKRFVDNSEETSIFDQGNVRFFMTNYLVTALILALVSSAWIYPMRPAIVNDILLLTILAFSLFLLYRLHRKRFVPFLVLIIVLTILNETIIMLRGSGLLSRIFLYIEILYTAYVLFYFMTRYRKLDNHLKYKVWNILYFFSFIFALFLFLSLVGNTFGFVGLSILLANTVVNAIITAIVYTLISMILDNIVIVLFEMKFFQRSNIIRENKSTLVNSINITTGVIIIGFWINSIIVSMGFSDQFWGWVGELLNSSWKIGTSTISVGAVIGVIVVIVVTTVIIRIINILLDKEIFPRIRLPRGVPGAISMITRYIIVGFGIYFVLSVAGIDLSKFGLIAGTLGVGIGFGLQNIVFNFIAGLVLAFERPFQVGDVIEVDKLLGTVTSIGVRSSTIKTYDGSEVIVPNGNLISTDVINWTLSDRRKRREVPVSVAYGSDPREVKEVLLKVAEENINVLKSPAPWATFEGFGESSLDFKIRFWVALDIGMTVKSEVAMSIYDALEEAGIKIPFPQQDLYIKEFINENPGKTNRSTTLKKKTGKNKPTGPESNSNNMDKD